MTLAELGTVFSEDEGAVGILGPGELQRVQDKALPQRVRQVLFRTYDMGDSHHRIIDCVKTTSRKGDSLSKFESITTVLEEWSPQIPKLGPVLEMNA